MNATAQGPSAASPVTVGLVGLAAAMGIGRFALTPLLPLLEAEAGLTLGEGSMLAAANYAGYLAGAVGCALVHVPPVRLARIGLVVVAMSTLAMAMTGSYAAWLLWRFAAGVASALVLVGVSAWALRRIALANRSHWAGLVFAGVGVGIALAGLVVLAIGLRGASANTGWIVLGVVAALAAVLLWRPLGSNGASAEAASTRVTRFGTDGWRLVICYGAFGFGYILPATFLPSLARQQIADPAVFGWVWPVLGIAAALSTVATSLLLPKAAPRRVWAIAQFVMVAGVVAPVAVPGVPSLVLAAVAVGGTFMVITMSGLQEARRVAGESATRLMAAMTAAFALGQLAGPVVVGLLHADARALYIGSIAAAALLALGATVLIATMPAHASRARTS